MRKNKLLLGSALLFGLVLLVLTLFGTGQSPVEASSHVSTKPVFWTWGVPVPGGSSNLIRSDNGISGQLTTSELPAGQAMTLWFIVFNNPLECVGGPYNCGPADLGASRAGKGDFLLASGNVVGASGNASFGSHVNAGDVSGSGLAEIGCVPGYPNCGGPVGLLADKVDSALIILAVHSHGPALTGPDLVSQISTYLGGCTDFTGSIPGGFAANESEVPDASGECSTFQVSPHMP